MYIYNHAIMQHCTVLEQYFAFTLIICTCKIAIGVCMYLSDVVYVHVNSANIKITGLKTYKHTSHYIYFSYNRDIYLTGPEQVLQLVRIWPDYI